MAHQALLDLAGADAVAGRGDHIVLTPDEAQRAVLVHDAEVAGQQPVAVELGRRRLLVPPVAEEHDGVRPADGDLARLAGRQRLAGAVQHRDLMARYRAPEPARPDREQARAIADHEIAFRLPVELVDGEAEHLAPPAEQLLAQALAAAADAAHGQPGRALRGPGRLAHHLERRRRQERIADLVARNQSERLLRVELARARGQHRHAGRPGRQQHIQQPAGPGPVRRRPEQVPRLREELLRQRHARQVPRQHPVAVQRALGRAGGAGGVDEQGRVVGPRIDRLEAVGGPLDHVPEVLRDHGRERRQVERGNLPAAFRVGDERLRAGMAEPVGQRFLAEKREERQRHRAELVGGEMGKPGLDALPQQHRHPVAAPDARGGERVGQPAGEPRELPERPEAGLAARRVRADHRRAVAPDMPLAGVLRDVVAGRHLPAERRAHRLPAFAALDDHPRAGSRSNRRISPSNSGPAAGKRRASSGSWPGIRWSRESMRAPSVR